MSFLGYGACPECGVPIPLQEVIAHECAREHWIAFQLAKARAEIESIDAELATYLESAHGKFDAWYAARTRRAA